MDLIPLKIGTRGSKLALWQAVYTQRSLTALGGREPEVVIIRTSGDRFQDVPLDQAGGVGLFTKEIERALLDREVDLAVHSLKDLPVEQPEGLVLGAIPERAAVGDLLLVRREAVADGRVPLRAGSTVGTSSPRRRALLAHFSPTLQAVPMRGNVPTRIQRVLDGQCDALVMARAGVERLGLDPSPLVAFDLNPRLWPCAPGQGALGLECRRDDDGTRALLAGMEHAATRACVAAERRLLQVSGGGCHSAFAALAELVPPPVADDGAEGSAPLARVTLALLTSSGVFRSRVFHGASIQQARLAAEAWLMQGAPEAPEPSPIEEQWLCRPALVWY